MAGKRKDDPVAEFFSAVSEALSEVTRGALTDIRQKVVEEPWFGRAVTPPARLNISERLGWTQPELDGQAEKAKAWDTLCEKLGKERAHQPEPEIPREHDLDR